MFCVCDTTGCTRNTSRQASLHLLRWGRGRNELAQCCSAERVFAEEFLVGANPTETVRVLLFLRLNTVVRRFGNLLFELGVAHLELQGLCSTAYSVLFFFSVAENRRAGVFSGVFFFSLPLGLRDMPRLFAAEQRPITCAEQFWTFVTFQNASAHQKQLPNTGLLHCRLLNSRSCGSEQRTPR